MKKIISIFMSMVLAFTMFDFSASAFSYFDLYDTTGVDVYVNEAFYDLLGKIRAGADELDLSSTVTLEKQKLATIIGAKTPVKFVRYKFKLKKKDTVKFTLKGTANYIADCTAVFIANDNHEYFYQGGFRRTSRVHSAKFSDSVTLSKGNYYLYVAAQGYENGTLDVTVSAPKHKETKPKFEVEALNNCKIKISWKAVPNATKYKIYKFSSGKFTAVKTTTKKSYTIKNLINGNRYSYIVSAYVNGKWTSLSEKDVISVNARKKV